MEEDTYLYFENSDIELSYEEQREHKIYDFLSNYIEDILDIFFYFEKAWKDTPEFLEYSLSTSEKLLSFLIDSIFYQRHQEKISEAKYMKLQKFMEEYYEQINSSYTIIYNFSRQFENPINPNDWILFCYKESFIP